MDTIVLEPINIAVIAPTGAGKTALISTICSYIEENSDKADGYTLELESDAARELNNFDVAVSNKLAGLNMKFESQALLPPTDGCDTYEFSMNFEDETSGISVKQPFKVLDIPGKFINDRLGFKGDSAYNEFVKHLDHSRILWIPIDTPIMMECNAPDERSLSDFIRCSTNLKHFAVEWAQFAAKNKKIDYCNFVLIKSEKYFSQDILEQYQSELPTRFDQAYGGIVKAMQKHNKEDKISCVAVETIGAVKVGDVEWGDKNCKVEYIATGREREIRGADCLLRDALFVAKSNVNDEIKIQVAAKENDRTRFAANLDYIIKEHEQNIMFLEIREQELGREEQELRNVEQQVKDASWWEKLKDTFGFGSLPELKEKIRNLQAHRLSLSAEIKTGKAKIEDLRSRRDDTKMCISNIDTEISALKKVIVWFDNLSCGNIDSRYYRNL